jgi:hypothetical protein
MTFEYIQGVITMKNKGKYPYTILILILMIFSINLAEAASAESVLPPTSNAYWKSYAEWSAAWTQWALGIPASANPILDTTGDYAANGQLGKVWFLAGTTGGTAVRTISVPTGTPLFFPIVNSFWVNTPEYGDPAWSPAQEAAARDFIAGQIDTATDLTLQIDDRSINNLYDFRFQSTAALCNIPPDNIFGVSLVNNPYDCVADGYWVLLAPLSIGQHTIHFTGGLSSSGFSLDVTYHITVKPGPKGRLLLHN